jgi:hypothetical protein
VNIRSSTRQRVIYTADFQRHPASDELFSVRRPESLQAGHDSVAAHILVTD